MARIRPWPPNWVLYAKYAGMKVVHRRGQKSDGDREIAWLSDLTRPFVLVLAEATVEYPLGPFAHLGVACESQGEVDRLAAVEDGLGIHAGAL